MITNYYNHLPKDNKIVYNNPNECHLVPVHPCKILITGRSGNTNKKAGKTNLVLNIIEKCNNFERYYLFCKMLGNDPLYDELLIPKLQQLEDKFNTSILIIKSNSLDDVPNVNSELIDPKYQNLIIFDDMIDEDKKSLRKVEQYFVMMRKKNCSMIFITQNYFETPKTIRKNCDYFLFTSLSGENDLSEIYQDQAKNDITKEQFIQMYKNAVQDGHLMIDKNMSDVKLKFRKNFSILFS
jgi:hypothetical protein